MASDSSDYEDRHPFKDRAPDEVSHLGMTHSAADELGTVTGDPEERERLSGRPALYRLVLQGMPVPGLPEQVDVGHVRLIQAEGPIWTQRTHIVQRPGWRPVYEKWMEHLPVGDNYRLTVCELPVTLSSDMSADVIRWRDEARAAVSLLVSLFDERIAQMEMAEDVIAEKRQPGEKTRVFDARERLREFTPTSRVRRRDASALDRLSRVDTAEAGPVLAAGRWYLRAAQAGPSPDAIVFLWIALEALSKPPWGTKRSKPQKKLTDVERVEGAIASAGLNPSAIEPSVGRLHGLRAEVVHGGVEAPNLLREGFYSLEAVARLLLRWHLGVTPDTGWPLQPGVPNLRAPFRQLALAGHMLRKIVWRDPIR